MGKFFLRSSIGLLLLVIAVMAMALPPALAEGPSSDIGGSGITGLTEEENKGRVASRPSDCNSEVVNIARSGEPAKQRLTPQNCIFLEEPIGGKPGYDLFVINCNLEGDAKGCDYTPWNGEAIMAPSHGPVQAILSWVPGEEANQGFALFYAYLGLIYKYFSGIIIGMVILFIIVGGIQMITSAGDTAAFDKGKSRIVRAVVGLIVWFLASLILYTINPTFFVY